MRTLLIIGLLFVVNVSTTAQTRRRPSKDTTTSLTSRQIAERVSKSLVLISTKDADGDPLAQGSGFFFKSGFVATNLHVFERAWQGSIEVISTGKTYEVVEIVGVDVSRDICVFKIHLESTPTLALSNSRQEGVGDEIYVAGNPEGLKGSFSKGIISAIRTNPDLIQIDASISPGSSGGPVVNSKAEVIGITIAALTSGQHLNFAVPVKFLSNLPLRHRLPVNVAGALAVSDTENQKLNGPVRSVVIKESRYVYSPSQNQCVEGAVRIKEMRTFNLTGNETEWISYKFDGDISSRLLSEYDPYGFKARLLSFWSGGQTESRFSESEWIEHKYKFRTYSNVLTLEDTQVKYDRNGNEIQRRYKDRQDGAAMRDVYEYDRTGKLFKNELYEDENSLVFSFRYVYDQQDRYGNWTRRIKLRSDVEDPCDATLPPEVLYREITYYSL